MKHRLLTQDMLRIRQIYFTPGCVMCRNYPIETPLHLFFMCPIAIHIWWEVSRDIGFQMFQLNEMMKDIFLCSWAPYVRDNNKYNTWITHFIMMSWEIWKEKNVRVFTRRERPLNTILQTITTEAKLYLQCCNWQKGGDVDSVFMRE
jgi:zinc-binding in reverse transcriptase